MMVTGFLVYALPLQKSQVFSFAILLHLALSSPAVARSGSCRFTTGLVIDTTLARMFNHLLFPSISFVFHGLSVYLYGAILTGWARSALVFPEHIGAVVHIFVNIAIILAP
jgi:hypothetical protein